MDGLAVENPEETPSNNITQSEDVTPSEDSPSNDITSSEDITPSNSTDNVDVDEIDVAASGDESDDDIEKMFQCEWEMKNFQNGKIFK